MKSITSTHSIFIDSVILLLQKGRQAERSECSGWTGSMTSRNSTAVAVNSRGHSSMSKEGRDPIKLVGELIVVELRQKWIQKRSCCAFYTHTGC